MSNIDIINKGIEKAKLIRDKAILESLKSIAAQSIAHAMEVKGYDHKTFNLHDSYGYGVYKDGSLVYMHMNDPEAVNADSKGTKGSILGSDFIKGYSSGRGWSLIVVAGEFYAATLEKLYHLDVLTGAYQFTGDNFMDTFKKMKK